MKKPVKQGFTLVELSLSLVLIGVLSLTIAMIINDTVGTYRRGVTLNLINTVGMDIVDDMRSAVQNSSAYSPDNTCKGWYDNNTGGGAYQDCINDGGQRFSYLLRRAEANNGEKKISIPVAGIFCTGEYSYLWNSGYFFAEKLGLNPVFTIPDINMISLARTDDEGVILKDSGGNPIIYDGFRLLKVHDKTRAVCKSAVSKNKYEERKEDDNFIQVFKVEDVLVDEPVEILANDDNNSSMALYDLEIFGPATNVANNSVFYSVSFVLGTLEGGANIKGVGNLCATPNDYKNENFDYCAINKFNFAAEALGEYNEG